MGSGQGKFRNPYGMDIDPSGKYLYISDCPNNTVKKYTLDGELILEWGRKGNGQGEFDNPAELKVNSKGVVYVSDELNHRIQMFDPDGNYLGQFGELGSENGQLNSPLGLAIDSDDNVFVADFLNRRIQKFDARGKYLLQWGRVGKKGARPGEFFGPYYIAVDSSDNVYVTDPSLNRVQKFTNYGEFITQWGTGGKVESRGGGPGRFDAMHGIAIDAEGRVYLADLYNHRVQIFDSDGTYLSEFGSDATITPKVIAIDSNQDVYVAGALNGFAPITKWTNSQAGHFRWSIRRP